MSNIPKLRFPEFSGEWEEKKLNSIFTKITQRNSDNQNSNVITNSATEGLVSQRDYFDKDIANKDKTDNYFIIKNGDFVYNPRKSSAAPYGPFTQYKLLNDGIVSPLYLCLRKNNSEVESKYLENYFKTTCWHQYIYENGSSGARHDRVSIHDDVLLAMPIKVSSLPEQQKIADFLSNVDSIIAVEIKILNTLQKKKKALMQKFFSQQLRFKSDDGTDFPAWEEKKLWEVCDTVTDYVAAGSFADIAANVDYKKDPDYAQLIRTVDLKNNFTNKEFVYVDKKAFDYLFRVNLNKDYIVLPNIGANIGEVYYISATKLPYKRNVLGPNAILIGSSNNLLYCHIFFQSEVFQKKLSLIVAASGQPKFNKTELKQITIPLPCKAEQQKIADCLSSMDSLIQTQQKVVTIWQQRKKALLQQMFI